MPTRLLGLVLLLAACREEPAPAKCAGRPEPCACERREDCGGAASHACLQHVCRRLCRAPGECLPGEVCDDLVCRRAYCNTDAECAAAGEQCYAGECRIPVRDADVASCLVLPLRAVLREGGSRAFAVFARDAAGTGLPWRGAAQWSVDEPARASVAPGPGTAVVTGGADGGAVRISASIPGGPACEPAGVQNHARAPEGALRVVVVDLWSALPVPDARVVVAAGGGATSALTDERGVALFENPPAPPRDVHVFEKLHGYVTYVGTRAPDLAVFLRPFPSRNGFTGDFPLARFAGLAVAGETARFAFFGSSIPANPLDLQTATVFGRLLPVQVDLAGVQAAVTLPSGVVFGVNDRMFRDRYDVYAPSGVRTVFGLGGNTDFNALFASLAPLLLSDGSIATGKLLGLLLPLVNELQLGVATGLRTPFTSDLSPIDLKLDTPLRMRLLARVPRLPAYRHAGGAKQLEGALVMGGALLPGQGFVPLGVTAGLDAADDEAPDGFVAPAEPGLRAGLLPLRLAPRQKGLESGALATVTLAVSFSRLGLGGDAQPGAPLAVSGLVHFPGELPSNASGVEVGPNQEFQPFPEGLRLRGRTFVRDGPAAGSTFTRVDIGSSWGGEWFVHLPADVREYAVPWPPEGFDDRLVAGAEDPPVEVLVQSARLSGAAADLDAVVSFGGVRLDDLDGRLEAFSTLEVFPEP